MDYNTQLPKMIIPEYGRNIQHMINHCCAIEDREESIDKALVSAKQAESKLSNLKIEQQEFLNLAL